MKFMTYKCCNFSGQQSLEHTQTTMEISNDADHETDVFGSIDTSRVKRRLFEDDDTPSEPENTKQESVLDANGNTSESASDSWSVKPGATKYHHETVTQKEIVKILLITKSEDCTLLQLIEERSRLLFGSSVINQCSPSNILRLCCSTVYTLIFLDMNAENDEPFLRAANTIRRSSLTNRTTPLVGLKFNAVIKCEGFKKFGIADIVYGPVYHSVIDQLLTTWISSKAQAKAPCNASSNYGSNQSVSVVTVASTSENADDASAPEEARHSSAVSSSGKSGHQSLVSNGTKYYIDSDNRLPYGSDVSGGAHSISASSSTILPRLYTQRMGSTNKQLTNFPIMPKIHYQTSTRSTPNSDTVDQSLPDQTEPNNIPSSVSYQGSAWNSVQQGSGGFQPQVKCGSGVLPSYVTKENNLNRNITTPTMCNLYPTPPPTLGASACRYPLVTPISYAPIPPHQNCSYVINGTPGTSGMRITYIPDELNKHSSKERERRERIKESCNQLRAILPRQAMNGRKADMATVLEMAVFYLRAIQNHVPQHIQQQVSQFFCSFQSKCKRKRGEANDSVEPTAKARMQDQACYTSHTNVPYLTDDSQSSLPSQFLYPTPNMGACSGLPMSSAFTHLQAPPQAPSHTFPYLAQYPYNNLHHSRQSQFMAGHQVIHPKVFQTDHIGQSLANQALNLYVDVSHGAKDSTLQSNDHASDALPTTQTF